MAIVLRGKLKGQKVKVNQWCNDWVSGQLENGIPKVFRISALEFTPFEIQEILNHSDNGFLFSMFYLDGFRFKKRRTYDQT